MQFVFFLFFLTIFIARASAQEDLSGWSISDEPNFDLFEVMPDGSGPDSSELDDEFTGISLANEELGFELALDSSGGSSLPLLDEGLGFESTLGPSDEFSLLMENEELGFEPTSDLENDVMPPEFNIASDCSSSSGALGRRGPTCTDRRYEFRPSRSTKDEPLILHSRPDDQICFSEVFLYAKFVLCDSGKEGDRVQIGDGSYNLANATPCKEHILPLVTFGC